MKLARSAPVVVVLLLLASGGTASGQTPQDCGSLANGVVVNTAEWLRPLGQVTADGNQVNLVSAKGNVWFYRYLCLPDTIDLRGPKGK